MDAIAGTAINSVMLAARVEETCLNAWPALQEVHYDGWLLRLADGKTRRTNSVNILRDGTRPLDEKIAFCEDFYCRHALPAHFRILSTQDRTLDRELARRGYVFADETVTLFMDFSEHPPRADSAGVELHETAPTREWVDARLAISGNPSQSRRKLEKILQQLSLPAVFAAVRGPTGQIDAVAKGAIHDGTVCVNLVATRESERRKGLSDACVSAIIDWAGQRGAHGACLQVVAANTPAIRLYNKLGFTRELYRYHYRSPSA
jgi:GNAT superfamily N-acetyltransferase